MFQSNTQFQCSECGKAIDIGEPFLASATYPARSFMQSEPIDGEFLQTHGEVLCNSCAVKRLGAASLSRLRGTVFDQPVSTEHARKQATKS